MAFAELIRTMTAAICRGDGAGAAECFTADGVYHDVFYGAFVGPDIARMVTDFFHRDGENFRWDIHAPVADGSVGYARYIFSYDSLLKGHEGRRSVFEGVAVCTLKEGLITSYSEVANSHTGLAMIGFEDARIGRFLQKQVDELRSRSETDGHFG